MSTKNKRESNVGWSRDSTVNRRNQYYAASQRKFVPYKEPLIF